MDLSNVPYIGEIFSLITAVTWASAIIIFKKISNSVHPLGINIFKNILAFILFILTLIIYKIDFYIPGVSINEYVFILLSGVLGIGVGDTLFLMCLEKLEASLTAIINCFYSPMIIGFSFIFLGETLSWIQLAGVLFVVLAIFTGSYQKKKSEVDRKNIIIGIIYGILALITMGIGVIIMKPFLDTYPLLWVTEVRLLGGIIVLIPLLYFHPKRQKIADSVVKTNQRSYLIIGSFLGAYLSMIVWMTGMKFTQVSTASVLNQTTNMFIFIFAAIFLKERLNILKSIGIVLALIGAIMVTFG